MSSEITGTPIAELKSPLSKVTAAAPQIHSESR
jgi:hypothetical protein